MHLVNIFANIMLIFGNSIFVIYELDKMLKLLVKELQAILMMSNMEDKVLINIIYTVLMNSIYKIA